MFQMDMIQGVLTGRLFTLPTRDAPQAAVTIEDAAVAAVKYREYFPRMIPVPRVRPAYNWNSLNFIVKLLFLSLL